MSTRRRPKAPRKSPTVLALEALAERMRLLTVALDAQTRALGELVARLDAEHAGDEHGLAVALAKEPPS